MLRYEGYATPPGPYFGANPPRDSAGPAATRPPLIPPRASQSQTVRLPSIHQLRQDAAPVSPPLYRSENRSPATSIASTERDVSPATSPRQSSHTGSTANYTWPKFQPGAAGSKPTLFVEYRNPAPAVPSRRTPELASPPTQSRSAFPFRSERAPVKHALPTPYPSLSAVTTTTRSSPEDLPQYTRPPPLRRQASTESAPQAGVASSRQFTPPGERELQNTFRKLELGAQGRGRRRHGGSPPYPYSSESESSSGRSPGAIGLARHSSLDPEADDWMRHAQALDGGGSSAQYACTWVDPRDSQRKPCGYTSKKHLVKRHIESKHLQIKPITCEICGKGFSQRTNYSTHMNTHTGDTPHKCPYPNCEATFGDPARRHRHMKAVHNHVPSKRRTQSDMLLGDVSEPEEEDSA